LRETRTQQKETAKEDPSYGKSGTIKPMVRTGISEVKSRMLSSSELGVSSGSEKEDGRGKESKNEAYVECLHWARLLSEDHESIEWVRCPKCLKCAHTVCADCIKRVCVRDKCKK